MYMKYSCGMYGGSFNPLHQGHVHCLIEAANQCETLIVVISEGINRNEIDVKIRYRWIYSLTRHIGNVRIFILQDSAPAKQDYTENLWYQDAEKVKAFAVEKIDAVFCGSDYGTDSFWHKCYPDAEIITIQRDGISSTELRNNPFLHWDWLPGIVRPHYTKKVLLIGGESTGKSTLTINLANYYNTNYLEEVGRNISERSGTDLLMLPSDFTDILLQHKMREIEAIKTANQILFEDTDCLTTLFYLHFLDSQSREKNEALAKAIAKLNTYDLIFFLEPDVPFIQDGDRSVKIADNRKTYSNQIESFYKENGFVFERLSGNYQQRFEQAVKKINQILSKEKMQ